MAHLPQSFGSLVCACNLYMMFHEWRFVGSTRKFFARSSWKSKVGLVNVVAVKNYGSPSHFVFTAGVKALVCTEVAHA